MLINSTRELILTYPFITITMDELGLVLLSDPRIYDIEYVLVNSLELLTIIISLGSKTQYYCRICRVL